MCIRDRCSPNENNHYPRYDDRRSRSHEDSQRRRSCKNVNDNPTERQESQQENLTSQPEGPDNGDNNRLNERRQ